MDEREERLSERLAADPADAEALRELAELVGAERRRKGEAVELWRRHVEAVGPERRPDALLQLARAQVEARREADAIATLQRCTAEAPERADAFDLLGELLRRGGRLEEATEALGRAVELDPEAVRPRVALAACYDALGRGREAEAVLRSLSELGAENPAVTALVRELMHRRG